MSTANQIHTRTQSNWTTIFPFSLLFRAVAEAATAAAAAAASGKTKGTGITGDVSGGGATRGNLPPAMVEVLKVSLSLLRRLCIKNLANVGGPFSSSMSMWYSAHPQVNNNSLRCAPFRAKSVRQQLSNLFTGDIRPTGSLPFHLHLCPWERVPTDHEKTSLPMVHQPAFSSGLVGAQVLDFIIRCSCVVLTMLDVVS